MLFRSVFGAALSGILYRISNGKLIFAVLGEVIGTGIIGAVVSYPIMTFLWGRAGLTWIFYIPMFTGATLMGGTIAFLFLTALQRGGTLIKMQKSLGAKIYARPAKVNL